MALDSNGNVWSWGDGSNGELGLNSTADKSLPQKVLGVGGTGYLEDIINIEAGYYSSYAVDRMGNVYSWGYNNNGQLGLNNTTTMRVPRQVLNDKGDGNLTEVMLASEGGYHATFVKYDGTVWTVGYNKNGELGNDTNINSKLVGCISNPTLDVDEKLITLPSGQTKKIKVTASAGFNLLTNDVEAGNNTFKSLNENVATVDKEGNVTAVSAGSTYIRITNANLGLTTTVKIVVPVRDGSTFAKIKGGVNHYVALKADGTVWTWGLNTSGQLGLGNTINKSEPTYTNLSGVIDIVAGAYFTAILKSDGTVWVSGQNNYGQLGQNTTEISNTFIQVKSETGVGYLTDVIAITANNYYMAALKKDGTVYAWGYNNYGQLGDNSTTTRKLPTRVRKVNNIMDISAGGNHLIMLDSDGTVWGTGLNTNGQLGRNTTSNSTVPVKVLNEAGNAEMTNILKIAGGANYTVLMSEDGKVYSFGYNNYGQLAQGNTTRKLLPVLAKDITGETITNAVDINARASVVSILRADGTAWTAGYNGYGSAGNGTTSTNTRYTQVLGELGQGVFSGGILVGNTDNTLAVADELGKVYTSGYNAKGQLGDGTTTNSKYLVGISNTSLEVKEPIIVLNTIGATKQIEAKVNLGFNILYNNLETENYTYKSLNPKIAEVDSKGIITAVKYGSTRVEVTNIETGNKATVIVTVLIEGLLANPKVESANDFTVALKSDGTVWTFGYNGYGQLGLGDTAKRTEPTKVEIEGIIDIACGTNHVLLLKQDGTIWAMGLNNYGQLGNNTTANALTPVQVQGLDNIIRISAGANHSIALKSDGTVWTWGYNAYGQIGDATTTRRSLPVQVRIKDGISEIDAGHHSSIALDSDGNVWVWGLNTSGQLGINTTSNVLTPVKVNIDDISAISMGTNYSILVKGSGEVYSLGINKNGQLGDGTTTNRKVPVKVVLPGNIPLTNIEYVSAGANHVLAKTYDGKAYGWGLDSSYQLGDELTTVKKNPVQIKYNKTSDIITEVLDVSAGFTHSVLVKEDGTVWTTGKNNNGQIGDKTTITRPAWVCISNTQIKVQETSITIDKIGGTYELKPILDTGFNLLYDNMTNADYAYASKNTEIANVNNTGIITGVKRGKTKIGITETNTNKTIYIDVYVLDEKDIAFPQVITTEYTTVALKADGTVWTWGLNDKGQLGLGDTTNRVTPTKVDIDNIVKIAVSQNHVLALKKDGTLWAFGANNYGQLGQGNQTNSLTPIQVKDSTGNGYLENIKEISTATNMSMALDKDGNVWTWGLNDAGQLGNGTKTNKSLPIKVTDISNITKVEGGNKSSYAIANDGTVYTWGYNNNGQLGDNTKTTRTKPVKLEGISGVIDISASNTDQVIVLKDDETVWGWGYSNLGALTDVGGATPKQILGLDGTRMKDISAISVGYYAGLSITNEGKVLGWGTNGFGGLGNGTTTNSSVPSYVKENTEKELSNVFIASMGRNYSVFAKEDGTVWSVGYNVHGELGNTSTINTTLPENISEDYISTDVLELVFNGLNDTKKINAKYIFGFNLYNYENTEGISFTSQDQSIATVDTNGNVTPVSIGKTYIDITSATLTRRIEVNVIKEDDIAVMDIQAGAKHTVGLKTNGTLWAFGDNTYGQLGIGEISGKTYEEPQPVSVGAPFGGIQEGHDITVPAETKFTKIAVGNNHTLALDTTGNVYSFGSNTNGQLGNGTNTNNGTVTKIEGLENIVKIVAYRNISMAIDKDGIAYVWGEGYTKLPTKISFHTKVIDITGKLILAETGTVWNMTNLSQRIAGISNIVEIASGDSHNLVLASNGDVYAWGNNSYGQLGTGDVKNSDNPALVGAPFGGIQEGHDTTVPAESIKAGQYNSYLLTRNGELYSFGRNTNNSLGTNTDEAYIANVTKIADNDIQRISAGQNYAVYVNDGGFVYSFGLNDKGQLGHGDKVTRKEPTLIGTVKVMTNEHVVTIAENEQYKLNVTLENTFNLRQDIIASDGFKFKTLDSNIATVKGDTVTGNNSGLTTIIAEHDQTSEVTNIYLEVLRKDSKSVIDVKAGENFTIALKSDGTVWSWGLNDKGQLGIKDNKNYNEPQNIEIDARVRQIAVGKSHAVILTEEGKVLTIGSNSNGQLGNGTTTDSNDQGKVMDTIAEVSAVGNTTYLLDYDGNVWAIGEGYNKAAVKIDDLESIAQISGKYGITKDNNVIDISTKQTINGLQNIVKVSEGVNHTLFLTKDGTVYAMGTNNSGQCGIGTKVNCLTPVLVKNNVGTGSLSNIKDISAGNNFSMAVSEFGDVYTWGSNENSKLGTEQITDQILPKKNGNMPNGIIVSAGYNHAVCVNIEGRVYDWGNGENGTLGNGVNANSVLPVLVGSEEIVVNTNHLTLAKNDTTTLQANIKTFNLIKDLEAGAMTFTSNDKEIVKVDSVTGVVTGVKEGTASITVTEDGTENKSIVQVSVIKEGTEIKPSVNTLNSTQVILKADGTVWVYGENSNGELGNGTKTSLDNVSQVQFADGIKIVEISVGESHVVALDSDGNVWTWGANTYYQLGKEGGTTTRPQMVSLPEKIIKISAGYNSTYAITEGNRLISWGLNTDGQLGIGNYESKSLPTQVQTMKNVLDVKAGKSHAIVITTEGKVYTVGNNSFGSLTGTEYKRNTFKPVDNLENIAYISAGEYHNLILTINRKLYVWGYNVYGQLGLGDTNTINTPTQITTIENVEEISAGKSHSIVLTKEGKIYATGLNSLGQFGNGTKDNKTEFTLIDNINEVYTAIAGNTYTMAIKNDGTAYGWGDYYHGASSNRTTTNSMLPVQIGNEMFYLKENDIAVNKNGTKQININGAFEFNVYDQTNSNNNYTYTSLNTDVATVDGAGLVTGIKVGTTWVKVVDNITKEEQIAIIRVVEEENIVAPKVAGGENYAVILKADGGIWSFGYNSNGELGNSTFAASKVPKEINILKSYKDIVTGSNFTLILRNDGTVWSVGDNQYGQLGLGNRTGVQTPTLVSSLKDVVKISARMRHSVALTSYGEVYVWGANENGELGTGNTDTIDTPTLISIPGVRIIDVVAGKNYTAFVTSDGYVYVAGNIAGITSQEPVRLERIANVAKVAGGEELIVLTKEGKVIKAGTTNTTLYGAKDAIDIAAKDGNYMLLTNSGKLYVWGSNSNGELGIGHTSNVNTPTLVDMDKTVISIGSGKNNTYFIEDTGRVYSAGLNVYGALGNDSNDNSNEYVLVGTGEFKVDPDNVLMSENDIVEFKVESERYNVLKQDKRETKDFEWISNDDSVVTVEDIAKIKGIAEGETTITVTCTDTGKTSEIKVVVEPLDAQRIDKISVNDVDAKVSGVKKYEVTIATDDDTGELYIKTKDATDQIMLVENEDTSNIDDVGAGLVSARIRTMVCRRTNSNNQFTK